MKRILYNIPVHSFLLAPALIFFLFVHNYTLSSFQSTLRSYAVALAISAFAFTLLYFLFRKNRHKAGVVTTFLMLILFFYGFLYEIAEKMFYKGWWPFSEIHRYILLAIFLSSCILIYLLFRTKRSFHSLTLAFNVFVLIFFFINLGQLPTAIMKDPGSSSHSGNNMKAAMPKADMLPDIYYIILDGYAHDSTLASVYNYKENSLTGFLKKNNFTIATESRTNYVSTSPSLSSSLNFSYLDTLLRTADKNVIYENNVSEYLKRKGYKIVHIRSGYNVSRENYYADTTFALNNLGEFERTLLKYTILRLDDLLGYAQYSTLKEQLGVIREALKVSGPKYTFIHIVSPHPPYVCDENGKYKASPRIVNVWWEPKEDYVAQLKFVNREVIDIISGILKKSKKDPIILVQSDHGPWSLSQDFNQLYDTRSKILNAYHIPNSSKTQPYPSITPVNSFRLIFNGLFNDSLPLLKDIPLDSSQVMNNANSNLIHTDLE